MVTATENGLSAAAVYQAARQLPREGRIVLFEKLAGSLREDDSLDSEVGFPSIEADDILGQIVSAKQEQFATIGRDLGVI